MGKIDQGLLYGPVSVEDYGTESSLKQTEGAAPSGSKMEALKKRHAEVVAELKKADGEIKASKAKQLHAEKVRSQPSLSFSSASLRHLCFLVHAFVVVISRCRLLRPSNINPSLFLISSPCIAGSRGSRGEGDPLK